MDRSTLLPTYVQNKYMRNKLLFRRRDLRTKNNSKYVHMSLMNDINAAEQYKRAFTSSYQRAPQNRDCLGECPS